MKIGEIDMKCRVVVIAICLFILFIETALVYGQGQPNGMAIIAVRTTAVGELGHVGVGFQNDNGTWTIGAIENSGGSPVVLPFFDNGGWVESYRALLEVAVKFHSLGYDGIKLIQLSGYDASLANSTINGFPTRGYNIINNNCLSATIDVLNAYGVKNLPSQIEHAAPNDYYANVQGEEFLWDSIKKRYTDVFNGVSLTASTDNPQGQSNAYQTYQPQPAPVTPTATQGSGDSVVGRWAFHFKEESWESSSREVTHDDDLADEWVSIIDFYNDGTFTDSYIRKDITGAQNDITGVFTGEWIQDGNTIHLQYNQENYAHEYGNYENSESLSGIIEGNIMSGAGSFLSHGTNLRSLDADLGSYSYDITGKLSWTASKIDNKGNVLSDQSKYNDEALESFNAGCAFRQQNKPVEAIRAFDRAIELNPQYLEAWINKGFTLEQMGNYEEARGNWETASQLFPNSPCPWFGMANCLNVLGRSAEAETARVNGEQLAKLYGMGMCV
jgi:tetratricopeptide (TPR) repeat protein